MADPAVLAARRPLTTTERNMGWALVGTVGLFALFALLGALEKNAAPDAPRSTRFIHEATETVGRLLAVAHTIVATLFLLTSSKVRSARGAATLAGLIGLSVAFCVGFTALGGRDERGIAMGLFTIYFLLHDLRDEAWFYGVNGDATPAEARHAGRWMTAFVLSILVATFAAGVAFGNPRLVHNLRMADWPAGSRAAAAACVVAAAIGAAHLSTGRLARGEPGGRRGAFARHRPLVLALVGVYAVFFANIAMTGRFYALVATHVVIWYVFSVRRIAKAPPPAIAPRAGSWTWMRSTVAGFNVLHIGILVALAGVAAVRAFAFQNDASHVVMGAFVSRTAFPLWTIVHVTLSWIPRR